MPTLFQWDLTQQHGIPMGVGIISGHRRLEEGIDIHTSPIRRAAMTKNDLQLETASGNVYHLQMKEWSPLVDGEEPMDPALLGLPPDFWARCAQIREEALRIEKIDMQSWIKPGTLFLRVVGTHILSAFWSGADSQIQDVTIGIHLGMFQDSYLIRSTYRKLEIDFRLFTMKDRLEPYRISQEIKLLQIRNEGCTDIVCGFSAEKIRCPFGAVTSIRVQSRIV